MAKIGMNTSEGKEKMLVVAEEVGEDDRYLFHVGRLVLQRTFP